MKICHLTSAHPDGDVRIFHKECVSLAKAGFDVSLIIPNTKSRIEKGVNIISFESNYTSRKERMTKTVKEVLTHALQVNADIYHIHDPELLKIVKNLKRKGKKVVYDVHEDLPRQILSKHWIPKPIRKTISVFTEVYENKIAKKCNGIVTATPFIKDRFIRINANTIDINNYPLASELQIIQPIDTEKNNICYIGGISLIRGVKQMIESVNNLHLNLLLAGEFESETVHSEVSKLEGWKNVKELGFISREEAIEIKKKSLAGLVVFLPEPNHINAQPNKMFEYMAAGIPVIASNFPLWKSIIETNNCGICVNPLNPTQIRDAINYLLNHPKEAKEMGLNGQKLVKKKYNWEVEEDKLLSFYNQL